MNEMTYLYREGMAELRAENEQLKQRIAELEGELDEIKGKNIIKLLEPFTHTLGLEDEPMSVIKAGIEILLKRIAELEAQQRWIPVTERLPENQIKSYLCYCNYKDEPNNYWWQEEFVWLGKHYRWDADEGIVISHYRELPVLPEVNNE